MFTYGVSYLARYNGSKFIRLALVTKAHKVKPTRSRAIRAAVDDVLAFLRAPSRHHHAYQFVRLRSISLQP